MGKGTIISGGTDGQYQVQVIYNTDRAQAEKTANLAKIANLETQISSEENEQKLNILKLQKLSLEKRNEALDAIPESETIQAWCADLTEDLTGDVGLIEVPGESQAFNIQPGHENNAVYDSDRDGQLFPTMAMSPANAFYNLAMLPAWQKWKPTYRYGTITAIDGDTADVTLETTTSTQQGLGVNQKSTLTGVPIEYMNCNGAAFEVGDEVLVRFTAQDWSSPVVVGFKDNPNPCCFFKEYFLSLNVEQIWELIGIPPDDLPRPAGFSYVHHSDYSTDITKEDYFWRIKYNSNGPVFVYQTTVEGNTCLDGSWQLVGPGTNLYVPFGRECYCTFQFDDIDYNAIVPFVNAWLVIDMELTSLYGSGPLPFIDDIYFRAWIKFSVPDSPEYPDGYVWEVGTSLILYPSDTQPRIKFATNVTDILNDYSGTEKISILLRSYYPETPNPYNCTEGTGSTYDYFSSDPGPMLYEFDANVYSITVCETDPPPDAIIF